MKQLTLRGIDPVLDSKLKLEAEKRGQSVNRTAIGLLKASLGIVTGQAKPAKYADLDHLAGAWSDKEASAFEDSLKCQRQIDENLWK
jgi:hypothetical protein